MQLQLMTWFRKAKRLPAWALLLAILTPTLLGLLPAPALSAEQQLLFDTNQHICSQLPPDQDQKQLPRQHEQCCILCSVPDTAILQADTEQQALLIHRDAQTIDSNYAVSALRRAPPDLRSTAPRAPPINLAL